MFLLRVVNCMNCILNWMYIHCLFHVFFMFIEFSRNRLVGDEPLLSDSSLYCLFLGSCRGIAWRSRLCRLATNVL